MKILQLLIIFWFSVVFCTMDIHQPYELAGSYFSGGYKLVGKQGQWSLNGSLRWMNDPCHAIDDRLNGSIAVVTTEAGCGEGTKAQQAKKNGAIGIIFIEYSAFTLPSGYKPNTVAGLDDFPMADVLLKGMSGRIKDAVIRGEDIHVEITPDPNPMFDETIWTPVTVIFFTWSAVNIGMAIYRLKDYIGVYGFNIRQLAQAVLLVEIWANIWRMLWSVNPAADGRGYYPFELQTWATTYSWPFSFIASILIAFYWQDRLQPLIDAGKSRFILLPRRFMLVLAIIAATLLLGFEHVGDSLRASRAVGALYTNAITPTINIIIAFLCLLYFLINGWRVYRMLQTLPGSVGPTINSTMEKKVAFLLVVSASGLLMFVVGAVAITIALQMDTPVRLTASFYCILDAGLDVTSTAQILCFTLPLAETPTQGTRTDLEPA